MGCTKDKTHEPFEPTKWEKIAGTYKVYDTTGVYLYTMEIEHSLGYNSFGNQIDSLVFKNFDDQHYFSTYQSLSSGSNKMQIRIIAPNPIKDKTNNRWQLYEVTDDVTNVWVDDTIILGFHRNNALYYLEDLTSYEDSTYRQVAVKQ